VTSEPLHSLRVKARDVEFELTSTAEEVAAARALLTPLVEAAFSGSGPPDEDAGSAADHVPQRKRKRRPPSSGSRRSGDGDREGVLEKLLDASVDRFPNVGDNPSSQLASYAILAWALDELEIDGLTAQEIQAFYDKRRRLKRSYQAYAQALAKRVPSGEIDIKGDKPQVYRIMNTGKTTLKGLLEEAG